MLYVTEEQRSRRPIFIATLRAARLLAGCFVAHRSKTTAGILPLRFAHPAKIRCSATTPVTDLVHQCYASSVGARRGSNNDSGSWDRLIFRQRLLMLVTADK